MINLYKDGTVDFIFTTGNKNDVDFEYYGLSDIYYGVNKMTNQMYIIIVTLYGLECFDFETIKSIIQNCVIVLVVVVWLEA